MRYLNSMHWPNQGFEQDWTELLKCLDPRSGVVLLSMALPHWYPELRKQMGPEFLIYCRMFAKADWPDGFSRVWSQLDPRVWAAECIRRLEAVSGALDDPYVIVCPDNEQQLECEGGWVPGSEMTAARFDQMYDWQYEWAVEMRQLRPAMRCKLSTAADADGHEIPGTQMDSQYQRYSYERLVTVVDVLADHAYSDGANNTGYWGLLRPIRVAGYREQVEEHAPINGMTDPGGLFEQYPDKAHALTETGTGKHGDKSLTGQTLQVIGDAYRAYSLRVVLAAPFLWNSADHGLANIQPNNDLWHGLQVMERIAAEEWPPTIGGGTTMAWDRHQVYDQWQKLFGGQGFNPADAFGKIISANPDKQYGAFAGGYHVEEPFIYAYTTVGIFCYDKRSGEARFATSESELPLA